ncbi:PLC-like phosphodiesterase [Lentinula edodes]|uniref:PLC-like phosphodiesterase n=1 Tax=Lentinula edodes TaxID=5353 RepID=UPI001E8E105C|nr:PLC-like phosphodiesterase [Lentinula edodes]KAH7877413.1 PLC-like phosphodiesterase [Lentinula edodes]KAJ3917110.1 PLC-like phosphodiesterase [Lentinula edodes]
MRYSFRRRLLLPQAFIQQLQLTAILYVSVAFGLAASVSESVQQSLAQAALAEILQRGAPILGFDAGCDPALNATCNWMANIPDETNLIHMSIPGTHDSSTWNYTQATQNSLLGYTGSITPAKYFQCQEHSYFQMLNGGIRVFDLRVALNPGNGTIGFYHSQALLAPNTRLEDVLFGFYYWLDAHPTEAVLLSINYEGGTGTQDTVAFQEQLYNILSGDLATQYWVQVNGTAKLEGNSPFCNGSTTVSFLLHLNNSKRIGIHLDPEDWHDNDPNITLVYNTVNGTEQVAYIEDYYEMDGLPTSASAAENIQWKYNATIAHLQDAINPDLHPDQLYITFASSEHDTDGETPRIMALGNGTEVPGVNQKILPWLQENKGKRFGIVMLDFFDSVPGVVEAIINA